MVLLQEETKNNGAKQEASVCGHVCEYGGQLGYNIQLMGKYELVINCPRTIDKSFSEK